MNGNVIYNPNLIPVINIPGTNAFYGAGKPLNVTSSIPVSDDEQILIYQDSDGQYRALSVPRATEAQSLQSNVGYANDQEAAIEKPGRKVLSLSDLVSATPEPNPVVLSIPQEDIAPQPRNVIPTSTTDIIRHGMLYKAIPRESRPVRSNTAPVINKTNSKNSARISSNVIIASLNNNTIQINNGECSSLMKKTLSKEKIMITKANEVRKNGIIKVAPSNGMGLKKSTVRTLNSSNIPTKSPNGIAPKAAKPLTTNETLHLAKPVENVNKSETNKNIVKLPADKPKASTVAKIDSSSNKNTTNNASSNKSYIMFDPVSKTRIIYRLFYPEDLNLQTDVGKEPASNVTKKYTMNRTKSKSRELDVESPSPPAPANEDRTTRSGRRVRVPRRITEPNATVTSPPAARKPVVRTAICKACNETFQGPRRLSQHYELFPDHKPKTGPQRAASGEKANSTATKKPARTILRFKSQEKCVDIENEKCDKLLTCLMEIIEKTPKKNRALVFIQQLETLISKVKAAFPCFLSNKPSSDTDTCTIGCHLSSIFGIPAGQHNLNMDAMNCINKENGICKHAQSLEIIEDNGPENTDQECGESELLDEGNTVCARTTSIHDWDIKNKRPTSHRDSESETGSWHTSELKSTPDIESDNFVDNANLWSPKQMVATNDVPHKWPTAKEMTNDNHNFRLPKKDVTLSNNVANFTTRNFNNIDLPMNSSSEVKDHTMEIDNVNQDEQSRESGKYEFHSAHFNIRSSPIKSNHMSFNKFQITNHDNSMLIKLTDQENSFPLPVVTFNDMTVQNMNNISNALGVSNRSEPSSLILDSAKLNINPNELDPHQISTDELKIPSLSNSMSEFPISDEPLHLGLNSSSELESIDKDASIKRIQRNLESSIASSQLNINDSLLPNVSNFDLRNNKGDNVLTQAIGETQLRRSEAMLSAHETSLDGSRLGLSSGQSVLQLLDPLSNDCLSFSDSDLRATSQMSLDLPLDLFPFHHP